MWRNCPISAEGSFVLWGGSVTNILYLYGTVCSETFELLKVHGQGLKLWIFLLADWLSSFGLSTLLWNDDLWSGRKDRSSVITLSRCSMQHRAQRECSLFTCVSCVIKMKHRWLSHSLLNNHFHMRVNDPIYGNVFHVHKSDYSLFQRFLLAG